VVTRNFGQLLKARWDQELFVCVGLDSELQKIPGNAGWESKEDCIFVFNQAIVRETADLVCAFKPNSAFYEDQGPAGLYALRRTVNFIHDFSPEVPVILDAKRGDIDNTNLGYIRMAFEFLGVDAITVSPYLGSAALEPFLKLRDKGVIVLCKTSNQGAGEFQDLLVEGEPLYLRVAKNVASQWNTNGNCGLVVGATYPDDLRKVRESVGDMFVLIPGIGTQEGDLKATVAAGMDSQRQGMVINSSRKIIFASGKADFAEAARRETLKLSGEINSYRK
jgi:orotidine-5'-phosphate decarboxylase